MKNIIIITRNSKILSLLFFLFAAALISGPVAAATLVLDGCPIPIETTAELNLATGDIIATSVSGIPSSCTDDTGGEGGTPAPTVNFTVNGLASTTITVGTDVTAQWSTTGADSCTASGGWSGSGWPSATKPISGIQTLSTNGVSPGIYSLSLACTNSGGTTTRNRSVTVQAPSIGECSTRPPPVGMTRETNMDWDNQSKTTLTWTDLWPHPFPGGSNTIKLRVRSGRYGALAFNTGTDKTTGQLSFNPPSGSFGSNVGTGNAIVTFSRCPGDFGPQDDARCRVAASNPNLSWSRTSSSFRCKIENNTDMFFNIVYSNDVLPLVWNCGGSTGQTCGHLVKP